MFAVDWLLADDAALWSAVPAGSRDFGCTAALSRLSCGADDGGGTLSVACDVTCSTVIRGVSYVLDDSCCW